MLNLDKKKLQEILIKVNKEELHYHQGKISDFDGGQEFLKKQDMHSADLDVFGVESYFYPFGEKPIGALVSLSQKP